MPHPSLATLRVGQPAQIVACKCSLPILERLSVMGFIAGKTIEVISTGQIMTVMILNRKIAIAKSLAEQIAVKSA